MSFDSRHYRDALGRFATGIAVITTIDGAGAPVGVTVNSFTSVSLEPPLVLFCLGQSAEVRPAFEAAGGFLVNLLSEAQRDLSARFAARDAAARWRGLDWRPGANGCPRLDGCLAHFECASERLIEGGDHLILLGRVTALSITDESGIRGRPLIYYHGRYRRLAADSEFDLPPER